MWTDGSDMTRTNDRPAVSADMLGTDRFDPPDSDDLEPLLTALADPVRRSLLVYILDHPEGVIDLEGCIDHLTEQGGPVATAVGDRHELEVALHHTHLPALEQAGIIEYDSVASMVEYTGPDGLREVVDLLTGFDEES